MTKEMLFVLACVPLFVVNSFTDKYASSKTENAYNLQYNLIKFLSGVVLMLPMFLLDNQPKFGYGPILCGALCGVMYTINKTLVLKGYDCTSVAFMTFCHAAGMIVPCVVGHFFWQEPLGLLALVGIGMTVVSITFLKDSGEKTKKFPLKGLLYGAAIFFSSGGVMIAQKTMGLYFADQSIGAYNWYSFVVAALLIGLFTKKKKVEVGSRKIIGVCAVLNAVALCTISMVMTSVSGKIPAALMFPMFNGAGILMASICAIFFFQERMTVKRVIGLILGIGGLCLINI